MAVTTFKDVEYRGLLLREPYNLMSIEGLLGQPDIRTADHPRLARHGFLPGSDLLGGRTITITVDVVGFDENSFAKAISDLQAAFVRADVEMPMTFKLPGVADGEVARVNVRPRKMAMPIGYNYFDFQTEVVIELFATDAYIYSESVTTDTLTQFVSDTGYSFPRSFNYTFGSSGAVNSRQVVNRGNVTSFPTVRLFGPITNPTVRNETTDQEVSLEIDIVSGDFVDIDMATRSVLLNGVTNRYHTLLNAEWWGIEPGLNSIRYSSPVAGTSTATITYRSAWV